jgi:hypothetical protein
VMVREDVGFEEVKRFISRLRVRGSEGLCLQFFYKSRVRLLAFQRPEGSFLEPQNGSRRS